MSEVKVAKKFTIPQILIVVAVVAVMLWTPLLTDKPENAVERAITLVQKDKLDQSGISVEDSKQIQDMFNVQGNDEYPATHFLSYILNSTGTMQEQTVDASVNYLLPDIDGGELEYYSGTIRFHMSRKPFHKWAIDRVETVQALTKTDSTN